MVTPDEVSPTACNVKAVSAPRATPPRVVVGPKNPVRFSVKEAARAGAATAKKKQASTVARKIKRMSYSRWIADCGKSNSSWTHVVRRDGSRHCSSRGVGE